MQNEKNNQAEIARLQSRINSAHDAVAFCLANGLDARAARKNLVNTTVQLNRLLNA
jgi:hypothetical protein